MRTHRTPALVVKTQLLFRDGDPSSINHARLDLLGKCACTQCSPTALQTARPDPGSACSSFGSELVVVSPDPSDEACCESAPNFLVEDLRFALRLFADTRLARLRRGR